MDLQVRYSPNCPDFRFDFVYNIANDAYTGALYNLKNIQFEDPDANWPKYELLDSEIGSYEALRSNVEQQFDENVVSPNTLAHIGVLDEYVALVFDPQIVLELIANDMEIEDPFLNLEGGVPLVYTEILEKKKCKTNNNDQNCIFPYLSEGITFDRCKTDVETPWCYVDEDFTTTGDCSDECLGN